MTNQPAPSSQQSASYQPGSIRMRPTLDALARNWGWVLARGIFAIIFGFLTFAWPGLTLLTLVIFYGAYAFVDGIAALIAAVTKGAPAPRWWLALVGVIGIGAGVVTLFYPGITGIILLYFIAFWAIAIGVFQIIGGIAMRKEIEGEWMLVVSGIISVAFGCFMIVYPIAGALSVAFLIGSFAILQGVILIAFALRLRQMAAVKI
ncbi:MAG TPA: HdeD family acid-resistance protein [Hyphomicrobiaceae bacterium]|nr:HdeD family acid-resistance protein [Hyphomicrobiaceae bacterium]